MAPVIGELCSDPPDVDAKREEHLHGHALTFAQDPDQEVLWRDLLRVVQVRLSPSKVEYLLCARGHWQVITRYVLAQAHDLADLCANRLKIRICGEDPRCMARGFSHQAQEKVFGAYVVVAQRLSLGLGKPEHRTCGRGHR
jgi:hypothetical protein